MGLCSQKQKQKQIAVFTNQIPPSITPTDTSAPEETLIEFKLNEAEPIPSLEEKLKIINTEIKKESSNPTKLYELLNKRLDLLPEDSIDELIQTLNQINTNLNVNRKTLIAEAIRGDDKAIQQVIDQGCHLTPHHFFLMISLGNEKFFKKAYEVFPINLNILFSNNRKDYYSFLEIAYRERNFNLFSYLLQIGANPNVTTFKGTRIIHKIAKDGEIDYAKLLLEFYPQTDISSFSSRIQSTIGISALSKNKIKEYKKTKENIRKYQASLNPQEQLRTPLMEATYHGHEKMVNFLLESKAEPFFESKKNEKNIMGLATSCREFGGTKVKKLNPNIILALIKKGGKIDSLLSEKNFEMTGLYYACQEGDIEAVKTLVEPQLGVFAINLIADNFRGSIA